MEKTLMLTAQTASVALTSVFAWAITQVVAIEEVGTIGNIAKSASVVTVLAVVAYMIWQSYKAAQVKITELYTLQHKDAREQHEKELANLKEIHAKEIEALKERLKVERSDKEHYRKELSDLRIAKDTDIQKLLTLIAKEK